jgi:FtsP/CotA-like multicopper oxidase with cupredoxin domain
MKLVAVAAAVTYVCPMHPEVVSEQPDRCPKCGMKLVDASLVTAASHEHEHHEHGHEHHDDGHTGQQHPEHAHDAHPAHEEAPAGEHDHAHQGHHDHDAGGIEWEDDMLELNRRTTPANMRWMLVDRDTGAANHGIEWQFTVGDRVKLRLVNEMDSDHPMHHPFHIHGAGRFVVLARNGVPEANYVWKDTVLVRTGETVDILLDVTNPGRWMAHCHIAEHHESGMMFSFDVAPAAARSSA